MDSGPARLGRSHHTRTPGRGGSLGCGPFARRVARCRPGIRRLRPQPEGTSVGQVCGLSAIGEDSEPARLSVSAHKNPAGLSDEAPLHRSSTLPTRRFAGYVPSRRKAADAVALALRLKRAKWAWRLESLPPNALSERWTARFDDLSWYLIVYLTFLRDLVRIRGWNRWFKNPHRTPPPPWESP